MIRNSATLFLQSYGTTTPVPWIDGSPDFSAFTEPTKSVLEKAWTDFVESGAEVEIIPDPEPVQEALVPNWQQWQLAILSNSSVVQAFEVLPKLITGSLTTLIGQVADKPDTVQSIAALWAQIASSIPQGVRNTIREAAIAANLPQEFVSII